MQFWDYVWLEIIKTGLVLLPLVVGWSLGRFIINYWDEKKSAGNLILKLQCNSINFTENSKRCQGSGGLLALPVGVPLSLSYQKPPLWIFSNVQLPPKAV